MNCLAKLRWEKHRWTQKELSKRSGVNVTYISQIECGDRLPSLDELEKLSLALDYPTQSILLLSWARVHDTRAKWRARFPGLAQRMPREPA